MQNLDELRQELKSPAVQGIALPARLEIERQILSRWSARLKLQASARALYNLTECLPKYLISRPRRLPGIPSASALLTEDLEMIGPSDYLGTEFEGTEQIQEPRAVIKH